ncbi:hypothetical protein OG394_18120 [Kribbella sp. NBC_01245]|uniref:hypothetical protein n=1 Tax=Kribbella sp. NBC_01245 TaxID=2903578 RepID=UPI002E2D2223|nr:hypothetical protein [Kribbella sp. NBC_01245]
MSKGTRRLAAGLMVSAGLMGGVVVGTQPAAAYPSNCHYGISSLGTVSAWCAGGSGSVRAVAGCEWFGWWTTAYGNWVNVNQGASHVSCPWPYGVRWGGFNARD